MAIMASMHRATRTGSGSIIIRSPQRAKETKEEEDKHEKAKRAVEEWKMVTPRKLVLTLHSARGLDANKSYYAVAWIEGSPEVRSPAAPGPSPVWKYVGHMALVGPVKCFHLHVEIVRTRRSDGGDEEEEGKKKRMTMDVGSCDDDPESSKREAVVGRLRIPVSRKWWWEAHYLDQGFHRTSSSRPPEFWEVADGDRFYAGTVRIAVRLIETHAVVELD